MIVLSTLLCLRGAYGEELRNPVKELLTSGKNVYGAFVSIAHPSVGNILAQSGVDFVWIDAEHAAVSIDQFLQIVMSVRGTRAIPLVRVSVNDVDHIKPFLDNGALGVVVPNIRTVQDAQKAVQALKYPPEGNRRVGLGYSTGYVSNLSDYLKSANRNILVVLMIETKEAVEHIDQILRVPGVDVFHVGLYDLSCSLGHLGQPDHPDVRKAVASVEAAAAKANATLGRAVGSLKQAEELSRKGYRFFTIGSDMEFLAAGVKRFYGDR